MIRPRSRLPGGRPPRNWGIYRIIQGAVSGATVGGLTGIVACCAGNALSGAFFVCTDWNQFACPWGALIITMLYLGCLGLPTGAIIAFPGGLLMGGLIRSCQLPKNRVWTIAWIWMAIFFGLTELINGWSVAINPVAPAIPGGWFHHLITLCGVASGVAHRERRCRCKTRLQ